ncbi:MAG TPA: MarR family transcriptional regulator [Solirubrobacteraceae bacterium]|jgi:DNA-binding MarR family transcriptional regulator|nr:MarR family transcriptional regulator [Solirubrobacteraceae bacterium]
MDANMRRGAQAAQEIGRDCLAVRVRLLGRAVTRIYDAALRPHGLTIAQLNLLTSIATRQPVAAGQVAELLSMEISTLSRNARLLEDDGLILIERARHGNGRVLSLTGAGADKLAELRPAWRAAQRQAQELLGDEAAGSIRRLVDRMFAEPGSAQSAE